MELHKRQVTRFSYDRSLLTCLVDRWRLETHMFHFSWGEMTPTLQDVSYLLGLPLAGAAIGPLEAENGCLASMHARFLAAVPTTTVLDNDHHGPLFRWLSQFQIVSLGYPNVELSQAQIDRSLEAYILWLFGRTMFTENHVTTVDARLIGIAREIADARCPENIVHRSFGSVVLAATYGGICKARQLKSRKAGLVGCPLLLQLWSYERFPIGRPYVSVGKPFGYEDMVGTYVPSNKDLPTMGSFWARREVFSKFVTI
uniref:Aminotransferase-like plant mobile domain-containing protein n=1 Tax=Hordeum vulgare subsp. vulgare TaxID=112509 RepID=A0A8I6XC07_HORVV